MTLVSLFFIVLSVLSCHAFPTENNSELSLIKEQVAALTKHLQDSDRRVDVLENTVQRENTTASDSALRQVDPVMVGFTARVNEKLHSLPLETTIIYGHVLYNIGSGYDETTGIFTCPLSGVYLFSIFVQASTLKSAAIEIIIDGTLSEISAISEQAVDGQDNIGGNMLITHISKGQRVWVRTYETDNQEIYPYFTTFSGVLIRSI